MLSDILEYIAGLMRERSWTEVNIFYRTYAFPVKSTDIIAFKLMNYSFAELALSI